MRLVEPHAGAEERYVFPDGRQVVVLSESSCVWLDVNGKRIDYDTHTEVTYDNSRKGRA